MDVRTEATRMDIAGTGPRRSFTRRAFSFALPFLVIVGAVGGVIALIVTAPKPDKNTEPPLPIAVEIATARAETTTLHVASQGQVKSKNDASVAAQVPGQIIEILPSFEPGAAVKKGEVIARIDPAQFRLAVDRSRSQVARAREALARARSEASLAERDWSDLGLEGDPSDLTLQKPQVNAAIADLRTAEAAVNESQLNLDRTEIRAPFDGRVKARMINVGDFVSTGAPIASIFDVDVAQVRIPLTDSDLAVLGLAPGFTAEADAAPTARLSAIVAGAPREWTGRLSLIEATVDPTTRLVYALVEVDDPFSAEVPLTPGLFAGVRIDSSAERELVAIPRSALKKNQHIYIVDKDFSIRARDVTPAMADATTLYFSNGIDAGERVVASFLPSPRDGMKVRDISAPTPKKEEPTTLAAAADKKKKKK